MSELTQRVEAEAVEQFGDDLYKLVRAFDRLCHRMHQDTCLEINQIPHQEHLEDIAKAYQKVGAELCRAADEHDEAVTLNLMSGRDI